MLKSSETPSAASEKRFSFGCPRAFASNSCLLACLLACFWYLLEDLILYPPIGLIGPLGYSSMLSFALSSVSCLLFHLIQNHNWKSF